MDNPLFFIVVIIAVIVLAVFLPRWVRRSSGSAGDRESRRISTSRLDETLRELGTTIVLHAPEAVTREIVDGIVLQQPRKFTVLPDGGYGIRFVEPDDTVVRLIEAEDGTHLQVEGFREYLGAPKTTQFWAELRSQVVAAATARSIVAEAGRDVRHRRDDTTGSWTLQ
ncbi:hypothetical protein ACTJKH_16395 [Microbacterium sp. 22215]|uniref:hypothetical protein n=1 Tax=Microbacterium sp. 22215 TaxID=3453893 RepID=UPI003F83C788